MLHLNHLGLAFYTSLKYRVINGPDKLLPYSILYTTNLSDVVATKSNGEIVELDGEDAVDAALKALKTNPLKDTSTVTINIKEPSTRKNLEKKAKTLALKYLRDRQLRSTLHKMSDRERRQLENILSDKGSIITVATQKLVNKISKIEQEKLLKKEQA